MKRYAAPLLLLAGLVGCTQTEKSPFKSAYGQGVSQQQAARQAAARGQASYQGPYGEPITAANNPMRGMSPGMAMPTGGFVAGSNPKAGADLIQAGYLADDNKGGVVQANHMSGHMGGGHMPAGPATPYYNGMKSGVLPVPQMGPPGAVSAVGALPFRMPQQMMNQRSSIHFVNPEGMRVTWFATNGWHDQPLVTPARYNFLQGGVYRLRLSSIPNRLERVYYPTLEVLPAQESTATYLAHSSVPVTFNDEDFEQVDSGNLLTKVVYLPNPANQDVATVVGPNELVSTRLEPGIDPIVEAQRRGTILLIIRLGNIDLNTPNSPPLDAPNPLLMRGPMMAMPQGGMPMGAPMQQPMTMPQGGMPMGNGPMAVPMAPANGVPANVPVIDFDKKDLKLEPIPEKKEAAADPKPALPVLNGGRPTTLPTVP